MDDSDFEVEEAHLCKCGLPALSACVVCAIPLCMSVCGAIDDGLALCEGCTQSLKGLEGIGADGVLDGEANAPSESDSALPAIAPAGNEVAPAPAKKKRKMSSLRVPSGSSSPG